MLFRSCRFCCFSGVGLRVISQNVSAFTFGRTFSDEWSGVMGVSKTPVGGFVSALLAGCCTQDYENDRQRGVLIFAYSQ